MSTLEIEKILLEDAEDASEENKLPKGLTEFSDYDQVKSYYNQKIKEGYEEIISKLNAMYFDYSKIEELKRRCVLIRKSVEHQSRFETINKKKLINEISYIIDTFYEQMYDTCNDEINLAKIQIKELFDYLTNQLNNAKSLNEKVSILMILKTGKLKDYLEKVINRIELINRYECSLEINSLISNLDNNIVSKLEKSNDIDTEDLWQMKRDIDGLGKIFKSTLKQNFLYIIGGYNHYDTSITYCIQDEKETIINRLQQLQRQESNINTDKAFNLIEDYKKMILSVKSLILKINKILKKYSESESLISSLNIYDQMLSRLYQNLYFDKDNFLSIRLTYSGYIDHRLEQLNEDISNILGLKSVRSFIKNKSLILIIKRLIINNDYYNQTIESNDAAENTLSSRINLDLSIDFSVGEKYNIEEIIEKINKLKYNRIFIEKLGRDEIIKLDPGQFCVYGPVLQFFPAYEGSMVSIKFSKNKIDAIRKFSVDGSHLGTITSYKLYPSDVASKMDTEQEQEQDQSENNKILNKIKKSRILTTAPYNMDKELGKKYLVSFSATDSTDSIIDLLTTDDKVYGLIYILMDANISPEMCLNNQVCKNIVNFHDAVQNTDFMLEMRKSSETYEKNLYKELIKKIDKSNIIISIQRVEYLSRIIHSYFSTLNENDIFYKNNRMNFLNLKLTDSFLYADEKSKMTKEVEDIQNEIELNKNIKISIPNILNNKNIKNIKYDTVQKYFQVLSSIYKYNLNYDFYYKINSKVIEELIRSNQIKNIEEFKNNFNLICNWERENKEINPADKNTRSIITNTLSIFNFIKDSESYIKYFEKTEQKLPELFILNKNYSDKNYRFRVLETGDTAALNEIGRLSDDCCQQVGLIGANSAIDSFINSYASVLVLECKDPNTGSWELASQSYFHYVSKEQDPKGPGFILDNIENASKICLKYKLNLSEIYAQYVKDIIGSHPEIKYIYCGKAFNDIDNNLFETIPYTKEVRRFHDEISDNPYTDVKGNIILDLSKYKLSISKKEKSTDEENKFNLFNMAKLRLKDVAAVNFIKVAIDLNSMIFYK